jgi:predicted small lipoprotein YifL
MSKYQQSVARTGNALTGKGSRYVALLLILISMQGCGQKGPLYLPAPQGAASAPSTGQSVSQP